MSHLVVDDLSKVKTTPNKLLIKPGPENNFIHIGDGDNKMKVWIDGSYDPEKHSVTYGKVVKLPLRLDEEFETEIELQEQDEIFFHYLCCMNAIRDKLYVIHENQLYYIINYNSIFCAKRDGETIMVNGNILIEPIIDNVQETDEWGLLLPQVRRNRKSLNEGIVVEAGSPLKSEKKCCDVGDTIFYRTGANAPLQYEMFNDFSPGKTVLRMKYGHIYGKLNGA